MIHTILISVTAFTLIVGAWTANLVCYHPSAAGTLNPLGPINLTVDWK